MSISSMISYFLGLELFVVIDVFCWCLELTDFLTEVDLVPFYFFYSSLLPFLDSYLLTLTPELLMFLGGLFWAEI